MVRLQRGSACIRPPGNGGVSIPLWFDCNPKHQPKAKPRLLVSIPLWFDCNAQAARERDDLLVHLHPTMVRLQHPPSAHVPPCLFRSPSHYGSTATNYLDTIAMKLTLLSPSHYGSTATQDLIKVLGEPLPSPSHYGSTATQV